MNFMGQGMSATEAMDLAIETTEGPQRRWASINWVVGRAHMQQVSSPGEGASPRDRPDGWLTSTSTFWNHSQLWKLPCDSLKDHRALKHETAITQGADCRCKAKLELLVKPRLSTHGTGLR